MKTVIKNTIPTSFTGATFNEIKVNLIDWLSSQDEFKDYDFTGSRMNILLDLLAYNTLYLQQFSQAAISESFIRTANLRSSVVQHAQDNGYYPEKRTASSVTVLAKFKNPLNPQHITIPRGTRFNAVVNGVDDYTFVTLKDTIIIRGNDNTYQSQIDLHQGRLVRTERSYKPLVPLLVHDETIDRETIRLFVNNLEWANWTNNPIVGSTGLSNVFYTRETIDGDTEFYFGEGVDDGTYNGSYIGGLAPIKGNRVVIEYLSTAGAAANGAKSYEYIDTLENIEVVSLKAIDEDSIDYVGSIGGGDPESIERIRELAPIFRESQRRCVTRQDYEAFVSEKFGSIVQAVQCYTDGNKPGYAFIAVKPKQGLRLSSVQKEDISNYLSKYNLAPITPVIIDPNYLYITHNINVTYSLGQLGESEEWLKGQIIDSINKYYTDDVELFNKNFSKSKLLSYTDAAHQSIIGSSCDIKVVREVQNFYKAPMSGIHYLNVVEEQSIISSEFDYNNGTEKYPIRYASTSKDSDGHAKLVVGPFKDGDITVEKYTGNDFHKMDSEYDNYYVVGEVKHIEDYIYFDLGALNKPSSSFEGAYIEISAIPEKDNIFAKDGSLIVFENDLRPQYTNITMEAISQ